MVKFEYIKMNEKVFIHVDMNAFFASIEQRDYPNLLGKPIAVTNGMHGSCIITSSYEARAFGIKTGMKFYDGKKLCPLLVRRPSRPHVYANVSTHIMKVLRNITPDIEIFSVDEAYLDLTNCMKIYKSINEVVYKIKDLIYESEGLKCSIGISYSKSLAKYASKLNKPDGITFINKSNYKLYLNNSPVESLCGVSKGIKKFLNLHGVYNCSDMKNIPISILANRFGNKGRKIWLMATGTDFEGLLKDSEHPKSIGHGKVLKPNTKDLYMVKKIFLKLSFKLSKRLRAGNYEANLFSIGIKIKSGWFQKKFKLKNLISDQKNIFKICMFYLNLFSPQIGIYQIQVTALNPSKINIQKCLFRKKDNYHDNIGEVIDSINNRFGSNLILPARLKFDRNDSPDVIAPAWRPAGHRKSV